jgi:hypothetical protein
MVEERSELRLWQNLETLNSLRVHCQSVRQGGGSAWQVGNVGPSLKARLMSLPLERTMAGKGHFLPTHCESILL